jgi:quercetin dioxygenase-like cupin family protein
MIHQLEQIQPREQFKGFHGRFIHTAYMTLAFWDVEEGAAIPLHSHSNEQVMQVLEGSFELTVGEETALYEKDTVIVIPPHVLHGGHAVTACKLLDVFSPVREDYK